MGVITPVTRMRTTIGDAAVAMRDHPIAHVAATSAVNQSSARSERRTPGVHTRLPETLTFPSGSHAGESSRGNWLGQRSGLTDGEQACRRVFECGNLAIAAAKHRTRAEHGLDRVVLRKEGPRSAALRRWANTRSILVERNGAGDHLHRQPTGHDPARTGGKMDAVST